MMDRIRCMDCGAESFTDGARTKLACGRCYESALAALRAVMDEARGKVTQETWAKGCSVLRWACVLRAPAASRSEGTHDA